MFNDPTETVVFIFVAFVLLLCGIVLLLLLDPRRLREMRECKHQNTRCIHGDEINARVKVYLFRFWKPAVTRRQVCTDCGAALERMAICAMTGMDIHVWHGPWPENVVLPHFEP